MKRTVGKRKGSVSLSIDENVIARAQMAADAQGRSLSNYVESVLKLAMPCEHFWAIDREDDLIKCTKCGVVETDG